LNYRWTFKNNANETHSQDIAKELNIPITLAKVLTARGITTVPAAKDFINPTSDKIYDPYLMSGMDKAVDRVTKALDLGEGIWIHGDYDVDGTASTAALLQFLRDIGGRVDFYIPDRFTDGYGLSKRSIDLAKANGASLLITVDVGITSIEPIEYAKSQGFEIIICDHHEPGDIIPEVYAILDPLLPGDMYPFKHLAACGVVFKFLQAISIRRNEPERAFQFLDFVALASAADMVPLVDENRVLVNYGLKLINSNPRPGLKGLIHCTRTEIGSITASNIVYAVAPIINAAGRMGDAIRSVEMMIHTDEIGAFRIAQQLEDENRKRRVFDQLTFEDSIPIAEKQIKEGRRSLVIHKPDWHAGVIGIVASRLVDRFNLPTVLMTTIDGLAKGSSRSINDFDVHSALKAASHLMVEFGGHRHAAGLSLEEKNIDEFREIFDDIARKYITTEMLLPEIMIDSELSFNELGPNFINTLNKFAPYGFQNPKLMFYTKNVKSVNGVKIFGQNNLRFRAMQHNFVIDAIAYNLGDKYKICSSGKPFSILYNIEVNAFNGQSLPQLNIKDIKFE